MNEEKPVVICAVIFLTQVSGMRRFELDWNHSRALTVRALPPPYLPSSSCTPRANRIHYLISALQLSKFNVNSELGKGRRVRD